MKISRFSIFAAIMLILAGVCMTLDSLGILGIDFVWWPLIIIAFGIYFMITHGFRFFNGFLILLGAWLLLNNNGFIPARYDDLFLAVLIIYIGICVLFRGFIPHTHHVHISNDCCSTSAPNAAFSDSNTFSSDDYVRCSSTFASNKVKCSSQNFTGGNLSSSFGELIVDLSDVTVSPSGAAIEVSVAFGEAVIIVPKNSVVHVSGNPFLGSINNKAYNSIPDMPVINIRASVSFGELEIIQ